MDAKTVGMIGLGLMGTALTERLREAGYTVRVYNRTREKAAPLVARGAQWAENPLAVCDRVLIGNMAYSRIMDSKGRKMIEGDFRTQARLPQHLKAIRLILAAAAGQELPLTETHRRLLEAAEAAGFGDADNSAVIRAFDRKSAEGWGQKDERDICRSRSRETSGRKAVLLALEPPAQPDRFKTTYP